jgi:hypothetical protein
MVAVDDGPFGGHASIFQPVEVSNVLTMLFMGMMSSIVHDFLWVWSK